ncbi:hypothetical protein [Streptomyces fradiae]|uniref:hypothetical protein n=1 Tax=Streptomyces fradiae TaxID=1906 RepID=UPI00351303C6
MPALHSLALGPLDDPPLPPIPEAAAELLIRLSGPGAAHERTGRELLLAEGVSARLARFAATHASWDAPGVGLDDLLVSLADKAWKNKRVPALEDLVVARLAEASGRERWEVFLELDGVLDAIGAGADARLAFQGAYPVM